MPGHTEECGQFSNGCHGECLDPPTVECDECGEESEFDECSEVSTTSGFYVVRCPKCNEEITLGGDSDSYREDFHADL